MPLVPVCASAFRSRSWVRTADSRSTGKKRRSRVAVSSAGAVGTRHKLMMGGDLSRDQLNSFESNDVRGYFQFTNDFGRTAIENFLLGTPTKYEVTIGQIPRRFRDWRANLFFADQWQVSSEARHLLGTSLLAGDHACRGRPPDCSPVWRRREQFRPPPVAGAATPVRLGHAGELRHLFRKNLSGHLSAGAQQSPAGSAVPDSASGSARSSGWNRPIKQRLQVLAPSGQPRSGDSLLAPIRPDT